MQHALWDARRELFAWVQEGAAIYVCGDANAMAKDVHATLLRVSPRNPAATKKPPPSICADAEAGRYLKDVY